LPIQERHGHGKGDRRRNDRPEDDWPVWAAKRNHGHSDEGIADRRPLPNSPVLWPRRGVDIALRRAPSLAMKPFWGTDENVLKQRAAYAAKVN
jgi:hypothetical protein